MKALCLILLLVYCAASVPRVNCQSVEATSRESSVDNARSSQLAQEVATILFSFNDQQVKSWALSQLANILWAHDENSARQFMQKALDSCSLNSSQTKSEREVLLSRRRTLISIISNHDAAWAETLIEDDRELTELERQDVNLATAYKLLDSSFEKSAGFIERARKPGLPDDLPFYLQALRAKSASAADALFVSTLSQLSAQQFVPAEVILAYGTYVFSAPGKDPYTISMKAAGGSMVYDISVNREGISLELTTLYLSTAAVLLERNLQTVDPTQIGLNYYTSSLLLEKAQQIAPELVRAFRSNLAANANRVSDVYARDISKRENIPASATKTDVEAGEDALLTAFYDHWLQRDYVAAQEVLDKVSAPGLRDDLQQVLSFRQIADELEKGVAPAKVKSSILKLPRNLESALLWCGLASAYVRQRKSDAARDSLLSAIIAMSGVKDHRLPYLLLNAAKIYSEFNPPLAGLMFKDAVKHFNALEIDPPPTISWHRKVEATQLSRDFPLRLKGLSDDIADVVPELAKDQNSDVYSVVLTLKDERLKGKSLISYLKFSLSKPTPRN